MGESFMTDNDAIRTMEKALKAAEDTINRQKAEIAKLEKVEKYADETIKAQAAEIERLTDTTKNINFAIKATNLNSDYDVGLRNGLRLALSFIDGKEPQYESCGGKDEK